MVGIPPSVPCPASAVRYNVAVDLLERNLRAHPDKCAFIDAAGRHTFRDIAARADRAGAALIGIGLRPGDRVAVCMLDSADWVCVFLGAIKAGLVPIALNTLLAAEDYAYILADSDARAAVVSDVLLATFGQGIERSAWDGTLIVAGEGTGRCRSLDALLAAAPPCPAPHDSTASDTAFWLYSSGSTGRPKGTPHRHAGPVRAAELYARDVFGLRDDDIVFSAAKLFFAYGLGNALFFPMAIGATAVLSPGRATPQAVAGLLAEHGVSILCAVPTLYGSLLASPYAPTRATRLRRCMSAGEALPTAIGREWAARTGTDIIDGIGSTEMLHIYVSNRPEDVRYGTTGRPVPGYDVRLIDERGEPVEPGAIGELYVRGPTMTPGYWRQPDRTRATFVDDWMRTGDLFMLHADGRLTHCGRADDMLKISGIWISPVEVENALIAHEAVLEAAVIGVTNADGLVKTKAFVVVRPGIARDPDLARTLQAFTKRRLAAYKYPRIIAFVDRLPKTATGKIRRHVLREQHAPATIAPHPIAVG